MTDFANPSTATGIDLKAMLGSLLLITVNGIEENIPTAYGPTSAVRADVVVLDGASKGETIDDTLIFPRVLQSQLKAHAGKSKVLGRLGQGTAKPGQSAPWILSEATDADKQAATAYLTYIASQQVAAPAAAAASTPW